MEACLSIFSYSSSMKIKDSIIISFFYSHRCYRVLWWLFWREKNVGETRGASNGEICSPSSEGQPTHRYQCGGFDG
jgi:hypothetical protein